MRTYLFAVLLCFLFVGSTVAQITITKADVQDSIDRIGSIWETDTVPTSDITTLNIGTASDSSQTFDFSTFPFYKYSNFLALQPSQTAYSSFFPAAQFATYDSGIAVSPQFSYYFTTDTGLYYLGGGPTGKPMPDDTPKVPELSLKLPSTYGTTWSIVYPP